MNPNVDQDAPLWATELRRQIEQLTARVAALECAQPAAVAALGEAAQAVAAAPAAPPKPEVTEEDMVFIGAAVAAFLGVSARIRQVRLVQSSAWAQVGRAAIHASHRVH